MRLTIPLLTLLLLDGCAAGPRASGESDYQQLARECREKGGVLLPTFGPLNGRPQTDNYCELRGGGGRVRGPSG